MLGWLCISNRTNFEVVKRENVWGVAKLYKNQLAKTSAGDKCAFYLVEERYENQKRKSAIGGIFEIISTPYEDASELFTPRKRNSTELYPFRVNLKPIIVFEPELLFKSIIQKLDFIINKKYYGGYMFGRAIRPLPLGDLETIYNEGIR
jgi:predicted RNA-binding protein